MNGVNRADIIHTGHTIILRLKFLYRYFQKNSKHCLRIYAGRNSKLCLRSSTDRIFTSFALQKICKKRLVLGDSSSPFCIFSECNRLSFINPDFIYFFNSRRQNMIYTKKVFICIPKQKVGKRIQKTFFHKSYISFVY